MLIDEEDLTTEGDMANTKEVITYITITNSILLNNHLLISLEEDAIGLVATTILVFNQTLTIFSKNYM
jgi:hypothetical protein